jgi:hypothetical protein
MKIRGLSIFAIEIKLNAGRHPKIIRYLNCFRITYIDGIKTHIVIKALITESYADIPFQCIIIFHYRNTETISKQTI